MKGKISNCMNDPISGNATIKAVGSKPPTLRRVFIVSYGGTRGYSKPSRVLDVSDGSHDRSTCGITCENQAQAIFRHSKQICNKQSKIETEKKG